MLFLHLLKILFLWIRTDAQIWPACLETHRYGRHAWRHIDAHGDTWTHMETHGHTWRHIYMAGMPGYARTHMDTHGRTWRHIYMAGMPGYARTHMDTHNTTYF
jgi:hypothetical protein